MDKTRHVGRVAIVTGAGSGIGRATALRLAQEGAHVIGCDVNAASLDETRTVMVGAASNVNGALVTSDGGWSTA